MKISIAYPVNPALASSYAQAKGFDPNEEFAVWQRSWRVAKWLFVALAVSLVLFTVSLVALGSVRDKTRFNLKAKDEGHLFLLAIPAAVGFMAAVLISLNLFEQWNAKRKAFRNMKKFAYDYADFLAAIIATDEEVGEWSEHKLRQACAATLEAQKSDIETMKSSRGKASRLEELTEIYHRMTAMGIRFDSVDSYIRDVRLSIRPKSKASRETKNKA